MRPARALWVYLLYVFAGSAILAPWIFFAMQKAGFAELRFSRVVDRTLLGLALLGVWPFVRSLGVRSAADFGLRNDKRIGANLAKGFCIGLGVLILGAVGSVLAGAAVVDHARTAAAWKKQFFNAAATAVTVAFLEEILFRGAIFTALRRTWNETGALWLSSAIYGILHFLAKPENPDHIGWSSGFFVLGSMLRGFADLETVIPGFFSITLLGVMFALAFKRSGALYLSMGLHAGVVFGVKIFGFATNAAEGGNRWFWGTDKLVDGWFCFVLLAIVTIWFARSAKTEKP